MSFAKMGSSAVAPPRRTAKRSSEIAPSTTGWLAMKRNPAKTDAIVIADFAGGSGFAAIARTNASAITAIAAHSA